MGQRPSLRVDAETREISWRVHATDRETAYEAEGDAMDLEIPGYRLTCSTIRGKAGSGRRVSLSLFFHCADSRVAATADEARRQLEVVAQVAQGPGE